MINLIACIDLDCSIGNKGTLLTKPPLDFAHFKKLTIGNYCVFGRKTFEEIGKPLSNRHNIILSKQDKSQFPLGVFVYPTVDEILKQYRNAEENVDLFICGGENVYKAFLPYADKLYLTIVDHSFSESDTKFPKINFDEWKVNESVENLADDTYPYDYYFVEYERKKV